MITFYAAVHIILGVGYIVVLGLWSAWDVWRGYKETGNVERLGFGLMAMGFTCGPHHIEHGIHILLDVTFSAIDLGFALVALPFPLAFMGLRIAAALGKSGDVEFRYTKAELANNVLLGFWLFWSFWTGASWMYLLVQYGLPAYTAGPQYVLAALFPVIGWLFFRANNLNTFRYRRSSLNSLLLAGLFITCGASHLITGTLLGAGVFAFQHLYLIDSFGVFAAILFLLLVYEKKWIIHETPSSNNLPKGR